MERHTLECCPSTDVRKSGVKEKGVSIMASISGSLCAVSGSVRLKLAGDFDGASAFELLDMVKKNGPGLRRVFIQTSSLKTIHPFGLHILENNLF